MSELKTVKFFIEGTFEENLFKYFAAEIIKKIYNYNKTEPTRVINFEFNTIINDEHFIKITDEYMKGNIIPIDTSKDIQLIGFFQRSDIFVHEREYLRSLFTEDNENYMSNRIKISNIFKYKSKYSNYPTKDDITIHIRLRDFYNKEQKTSQIYDPSYIKNILQSISYDKLYIVCEQATEEWEKGYLKEFDSLNPEYIIGTLGDEFDFLLNSERLLTSASILGWLAAFLGKAKEVHIPYNSYYGGYESTNQSLGDICSDTDNSVKCKVYYNTEYWLPSIDRD
jgi:hypothetical protein